jgi:hypothetical protein
MFKTTSLRPRAAAVLLATTMIAACGSTAPGASTSGTRLSEAQIHQAEHDAVSFAGCMHSHGLTDFPDSPYDQKHLLSSTNGQSPAVQAALAACHHFLPNGGQSQSPVPSKTQLSDELAFARCIRAHGFQHFPDPSSTGQLSHEMLASAGIDLHQPAVVQAADACVSVTHGFITKADVARFIAGR